MLSTLKEKNEKEEDPQLGLTLKMELSFAKNIAKQLSAKDPNNKGILRKISKNILIS